jgi:WD40 repeat protein
VEYAEFSPDGTKLITASGDRTARLWDAVTGRQLTEEPLEHAHSVLTARFSPDGLRVVTASLDKTARLWDAATGLALSDPLRHEAEVLSAAFRADGQQVITASMDKTAAIWEVQVAGPTIPRWLPELAESVGGLRLNDDRVPEPVSRDTYAALKARLTNLPDTEPLAELVRKCFGP